MMDKNNRMTYYETNRGTYKMPYQLQKYIIREIQSDNGSH